MSTLYYLLTTLVFAFLFLLYKLRIEPGWVYRSIMKQFPGPKPHWILGHNLLDLAGGDDIFGVIQKWRRDYGSCFRVWYSSTVPSLIIAKPSIVKKLLKGQLDINNYEKVFPFHAIICLTEVKGYDYEFRPWLGESILLSTGDQWRKKRRLLMPAFHSQSIQKMFPCLVACTTRLVERWQNVLKKEAERERDGKPLESLDIPAELKLASLDMIGIAAFGYRFSQDEGKRDEGDTKHDGNVLVAFETILEEIEKRSYHFIPLPNWLYCTFTPSGRRFISSVRLLRDLVYGIIKNRRQSESHTNEPKEEKKLDLLDLLLQAEDEDHTKFSDQQIQEDVVTFLFAGHETTSTCLSWTLYLLAQSENMDCTKTLLDEIESVCGSEAPTWEQMEHMPYLDCIIKESLRLYPPQPAFVRRAMNDNHIGKHFIPKGTEVSVVPYLIHRDEKYWERPLEFRPERFAKENRMKLTKFAYLPFSAGPRSCIGKSFAWMEARVALIMLLQNFSFKVAPDCSVVPVPAVTLQPYGLKLLVTQRIRNKQDKK